MYCTIMYMDPVGFDWDEGNREKNWIKHAVSAKECEEVFFNISHIIVDDPNHSQKETRYSMLGKTNNGRKLRVIFTTRNEYIRVISARDQSKKERRQYEQAEKTKKV